jgi:CRISPR-associated protein (TIGR02710 family)
MSPWSIFAEEERRQVVILFNHRRYSAVIEIIDNAFGKEMPIQIRDYFRFIQPLSEGFLKWDQFQHKDALKNLDAGLTKLADYLSTYPDNALESFSTQVKKCKDFIEKIITSTNGLKESDMVLIDDLLNNARRKIADKRYDDASARIYRALELYGQIIFHKTAGCSNDKVESKIIPEKLKEEYTRKYRDPHSHYLKLPLNATFKYLKAMGNDAGIRFFERIKEIKNIQSNRNSSILAHGILPVTEKAINSIFNTVCDFVQMENFFDFPELP